MNTGTASLELPYRVAKPKTVGNPPPFHSGQRVAERSRTLLKGTGQYSTEAKVFVGVMLEIAELGLEG